MEYESSTTLLSFDQGLDVLRNDEEFFPLDFNTNGPSEYDGFDTWTESQSLLVSDSDTLKVPLSSLSYDDIIKRRSTSFIPPRSTEQAIGEPNLLHGVKDFGVNPSLLFPGPASEPHRTLLIPQPNLDFFKASGCSLPKSTSAGGSLIGPRKTELDLNVPWVLDLYTQLVIFQRDSIKTEISFENSDHSKQDVLHALARKLGLEYENSLLLRRVTISKTPWVESRNMHFFQQTEPSSFNSTVASWESGSRLSHSLTDLTSPATSISFDFQNFEFIGSPEGVPKTPQPKSTQRQHEFIFVTDPVGSPEMESFRGRRGRLNDAARIESNAVKVVGACWKCKYLRKKCTGNPKSPCDTCLKSENDSTWQSIGCRRGPLQTQSPPLDLCPRTRPDPPGEASPPPESNLGSRSNLVPSPNVLSKYTTRQSRCFILNYISDITLQLSGMPEFECILKTTELYGLQLLWHRAVLPYADSEYNLLISKALACLRSCLELIRAEMSGKISRWVHRDCTKSSCMVGHSRDLRVQSQQYLNELSRIMLKKENLRGETAWRLPAFYSLCIQSLVRRSLISVFGSASTFQSDSTSSTQYLQLGAQLFIALSPGFETFMRNEDWGWVDPVKAPKLRVGHERWMEEVQRSASKYLEKQFDITDLPVSKTS